MPGLFKSILVPLEFEVSFSMVQDVTNDLGNNKRRSLTKLADMVDDHILYEERILTC
jgi:hypothetical protein